MEQKIIEMLEKMATQMYKLNSKLDDVNDRLKSIEHSADVSKAERERFDKKLKTLEKVTIRNWEEISEWNR